MNKRIMFVVLTLFAFSMSVQAAAPIDSVMPQSFDHDETVTIDSTLDVGFQHLYTFSYVMSDTCEAILTFTGIATLKPGTELWIGCGADSANRVSAANLVPHNNIDSTKVAACPLWANESFTFPFMYRMRVDSLRSQTDASDTVYLNAAVGGPRGETQLITNPYVRLELYDRD